MLATPEGVVMDTIVLRSDLHETLEKDAEREARSVNEIVNEAVERYLHERQIAKLDAEIAAFEKLRQKYLGQWVAIHEQKLIDHDSDRAALYKRVRATYGRTAILIRQVTERPDNEIWLRTPSTGKIEQ